MCKKRGFSCKIPLEPRGIVCYNNLALMAERAFVYAGKRPAFFMEGVGCAGLLFMLSYKFGGAAFGTGPFHHKIIDRKRLGRCE